MRRLHECLASVVVGLVLAAPSASAQGAASNGFQTTVRAAVSAPRAEVYDALVSVGRWWSSSHTYSGNAANLSIDPRPGGCFCERLPNGGGVEHMRVVYAAPGEALRMTGGLGPLQELGVSGSLTIALAPDGAGTAVSWTYRVGGFNAGGFDSLTTAVNGVLTEQLNRLKAYAESARQGAASAPAPAPGPASTVAYVDIQPASRAQAIDAFRAYREASRQEAGFVAIDVFEQVRRGAYYTIVETWANEAALEAHGRTSHTATLLAAMARLGISGYDQRPYGALSVAPARATNPQAVYVVTHVDTIPAQGSDPSGLLRSLAEKSRAEAGNVRFDVLQHAVRRNHFTIVETWANPAAAESHASAAHTREYRLAVLPLTGSPVDERLFRAVE